MATYLTADNHFGHKDIIRSCARPFASVEEMDAEMIRRWNETVGPDDDVWVVGDFGHRIHPRRLAEIFGALAGRKFLVPGNHDKGPTLDLKWAAKPKERVELELDGRLWILDHYAMRTWRNASRGSVHAFGHSHGRLPPSGLSCDVGVDCWDFRPITPAQALARMVEGMSPEEAETRLAGRWWGGRDAA